MQYAKFPNTVEVVRQGDEGPHRCSREKCNDTTQEIATMIDGLRGAIEETNASLDSTIKKTNAVRLAARRAKTSYPRLMRALRTPIPPAPIPPGKSGTGRS